MAAPLFTDADFAEESKTNPQNWGLREDNTPKGQGFLGALKRPDGRVSTELSIGVNIDGKEVEIPALVPTLTENEVRTLLNQSESDKIPRSIIDKAVSHARQRISSGKSPFATASETQTNLFPQFKRASIETHSAPLFTDADFAEVKESKSESPKGGIQTPTLADYEQASGLAPAAYTVNRPPVSVPRPTPKPQPGEFAMLSKEEQRRAVEQMLDAESAQEQLKETPGMLATIVREGGASVLPSLAAGGGFALGAELGAPLGPVGSLLGGLGGSMLTGGAATDIQDLAARTVAPEASARFQDLLEAGRREHPVAAAAGRLAGALPSFQVSLPRTVAELGKRAALGAGISAIPAITEGRLPTAEELAEAAAFTAIYGEPRAKALRVPIEPMKGGEPNAIYQEANGPVWNLRNASGKSAQQVPIEGGSPEATPRGSEALAKEEIPITSKVPSKGSQLDDLAKKGKSEKEVQKEEALRETVAPTTGAGQTAPEFTLTPAVEAEGRIFTGPNHADAIVHAAKNGVDALDAEHKFLGSDGKFYNRKEAGAIYEQKTGNKPKFEEGLHSTELEQAGLLNHVKGPGEVKPTAKAPPEQLTPAIAESEKSKVQPNTPAAMAVGIAPPGTELAQRIIDWASALPAKLAGKAAPLTSRASERSGNALVQFASAKTAAPLQAKSMATDVLGEHFKDADFSKKLGAVLVEDRLRAIKKSFNDQAQRDSTYAQQLAQQGKATEAAAAQRSAMEAQNNANNVESIVGKPDSPFASEADFTGALNDPEIEQAIIRHKHIVQLEAQIAHEETGGNLAGPGLNTDAFVNLKAVMPGAEEFFGGTSRGNLENPLKRKTRFGKEAKGTAEQYELDYRTLAERMIQGNFEEVAKRNLYKQLVDDGLAIVQKPGLPAPKIGGKPTVRFTIERRGGNVEYLWLRKDLAQEFRQAENVEGPISQGALITAAQALNRIQLRGPTDAVWHVANMMASIAGSQGGKNVLIDLARKFPGVNVADAVGRITASAIKVLADDPEIQRQLADIAKIGAGREAHAGGGFLSRSIHLIDKAGRLVRDDMYKNLVDRGLVEDNEATRREWINQLGNYNGRLMGQFQRIFKEAGFSPFIVAGRNFNRMAARRITLDPGIKAANPAAYWEMKGIEAFGIMATLVAVPSLINLATTGKPSGRPGVKFGQIDTGKDDADGKHIVIDPAQWTGLRRGLRISGAQSVIEGLRQGQPHAKIARNAITDALGGIIHPWAGPAVSAPVIGITGYSPTLYKESANPKDYGTNVKEALKQLNPVAEAAITAYEKKEGPAKYTSPITAIGKSLGGASGIKEVAPFTAQSQMYNLAHRWMEKSGDPKLLKKFERDLNADYGESDYKPLRQALQANDTDKAKAELAKLKEFKGKSDIMKAMRNAVTRSFSGSKATESKFLRSLTDEQRQQYNKAKEERREEYRRFREVWTK